MKCDLCKGELFTSTVLCENCSDAVRRLVKIVQAQQDGAEATLAFKSQTAAASRR